MPPTKTKITEFISTINSSGIYETKKAFKIGNTEYNYPGSIRADLVSIGGVTVKSLIVDDSFVTVGDGNPPELFQNTND